MIDWITRYYSLASLTYKTNRPNSQTCVTLFYNTRIILAGKSKKTELFYDTQGSLQGQERSLAPRHSLWAMIPSCGLAMPWWPAAQPSPRLLILRFFLEFAGRSLSIIFSLSFQGFQGFINEFTTLQVFYRWPIWEPWQLWPQALIGSEGHQAPSTVLLFCKHSLMNPIQRVLISWSLMLWWRLGAQQGLKRVSGLIHWTYGPEKTGHVKATLSSQCLIINFQNIS